MARTAARYYEAIDFTSIAWQAGHECEGYLRIISHVHLRHLHAVMEGVLREYFHVSHGCASDCSCRSVRRITCHRASRSGRRACSKSAHGR